MSLIAYIADVLKIDLFIPTHVKSQFSFGSILAKNDDLELVQWLENRGYNIHESKRELLKCAYDYKSNRVLQYVLEKQKETEAADLYMESIGSMAYHREDREMLLKYPVVNFYVSQSAIYRALSKNKEFLHIKILMDRYIVIQNSRFAKHSSYYAKTPKEHPILFETYHVPRFAKLATYGGVWSYISSILYQYGSSGARNMLIQTLGYIVGANDQQPPKPIVNSRNENVDDDWLEDLSDEEPEADVGELEADVGKLEADVEELEAEELEAEEDPI